MHNWPFLEPKNKMKTFNQFIEEAEEEKSEDKPKKRPAKKAPKRGINQERSNWKLFGHQS
jgi:hypothetical protein